MSAVSLDNLNEGKYIVGLLAFLQVVKWQYQDFMLGQLLKILKTV